MPRAVPRPPRPDLPAPRADTLARGVRVFDAAELGEVLKWTRGVRQLPQAEAAASLGVSPELLRGLERGDRGVRLQTALEVLARMGYDVVLVPRDPALALREGAAPPPPETERRRSR
ncbi:MAG TPA: hypothetical protein VFK39_12140 [Gemmatimonadaceae bacterium]|nr:hypothetical protein [Gemmatimonadaceae bacterium]